MRLIDADVLLEKFAELEATALDMCKRHMHDDDQTEWKRWSVILTERTAYRYDVLDAPTVDAVPVIRCCDCVHFEYFEDQFAQMTHCDVHDKCPDYTDFCSWAERKEE